jgi:hypothetical protein
MKTILSMVLFLLYTHPLFAANSQVSSNDAKGYANFRAIINKSSSNLCEPIIVSCTITIENEKKVYFSQSDKHYDFDITIVDSNQEKVPLTLKGTKEMKRGKFTGPLSTHDYPLIKGDSIYSQFLLNRYYDLTQEGNYKIIISLHLYDAELKKRIKIQSNEIVFTIKDEECMYASDTKVFSSFFTELDDLLKEN